MKSFALSAKRLSFRPHVWGFFFHWPVMRTAWKSWSSFRPHVWGSFFHASQYLKLLSMTILVFVPMFGDSFFTMKFSQVLDSSELFSTPCLGILFSPVMFQRKPILTISCFRPHVWGFFFHHGNLQLLQIHIYQSFRPHVWGFFFHSRPGMPHGVGSLWPFCGGDFQLIGFLIIFTL